MEKSKLYQNNNQGKNDIYLEYSLLNTGKNLENKSVKKLNAKEGKS